MAMINRLVGLCILIVMLFGSAMLGGKLSIFVDLPSIVMVVGVLFGGAMLCFPVGQIADAIGAVFAGDDAPAMNAWQREQRIAVFARLYQLAWGAGLVGALLGLIAKLSDLSNPASIGAGIAVSLLAPAYGALLAEFLFNPMQQMVMNQRPIDDDPEDVDRSSTRSARPTPVAPRGQSALFKGVAMLSLITALFMVTVVSFAEIKKEDVFSDQVEDIRQQFGLPHEDLPEIEDPSLTLIEQLEEIRLRQEHIPNSSNEDSRH